MARPTEYYVDPTIVADGGAGTKVSPWTRADGQVVQYALDNITRDATNGDRINIKAGTAHASLTSSLTLATYGTPSNYAPLCFQGYTTDEDDGGIGDIDFGDNTMFASAYNLINLKDLKCHNFGTNIALTTGAYWMIVNCEFTDGEKASSGSCVNLNGGRCHIQDCYLHDLGTGPVNNLTVLRIGGASTGTGNLVQGDSGRFGIGISGSYAWASHNVVYADTTLAGYTGISLDGASGNRCSFNSIYNASAGVYAGIYHNGNFATVIENNLIEGWSGVGAHAILGGSNTRNLVLRNNRWYNCTSGLDSNSLNSWCLYDNAALTASPFNDPATIDFTPSDEAKGEALPDNIGGTHTTTTPTYIDLGAAQSEATASGESCGRHIAIGGCAG